MNTIQTALESLLHHFQTGQARGLDVIFERLGEAGPYRVAGSRYPLRTVEPLHPSYPGDAGQSQAELAERLAQLVPSAQTTEAQLTLLERFGGFASAIQNGREVGGVSWFDQARLHAALEACGDSVLVLRADISGIQDFIYQEVEGRALKNLRARSFYLELLAVHVLRRLLNLAGMTRANVAYLGGGGFQLYLPASAQTAAQEYVTTFDDWLWQEHGGGLGLSVASCVLSRSQAEAGGQFQRDLSARLSEQKARRRRGRLAEVFGSPQDSQAREARENQLAEALEVFGGLLPGARSIEVQSVSDPGTSDDDAGWIVLHDQAYRPVRQGSSRPPASNRLALNTLEDLDAFPMLSGNYVTRGLDVPPALRIGSDDPRNVATHEQLVNLALGQPRLALFRCDADNMGQFFSGGIPGHNAARHATLSRLMGLFFQGYVNAICEGREPLLPEVPQAPRSPTPTHGRYLNIIYSGGDDAVVVGAWNEVLTFAVDLRLAYARYTGHNRQLGLSGGSFVAKAKFPLRRMAERAHDAEQLAKSARRGGNSGPTPDKDGFVPFLDAETPSDDPRRAARWDVFTPFSQGQPQQGHRTLEVLSAFLSLKNRGGWNGIELLTRRALLWQLRSFAEREGDVWRLPQLHYAVARATPPGSHSQEWAALKNTLLQPQTWPHLPHVLAFLHLARPTATDRDDETYSVERSKP